MQAVVQAADVQDRDGGVLLMGALFGLYPFLLKLYADSGYQGAKFRDGLATACAQVNVFRATTTGPSGSERCGGPGGRRRWLRLWLDQDRAAACRSSPAGAAAVR